jgi:beta propeller repeat protein
MEGRDLPRMAEKGGARTVRRLILAAIVIGSTVPVLATAGPLLQTGPSISPPVVLAGDGKTNSVSPSAAGNVMVYSDCSSGKCNISMINLTTRQATPITKADYNQFNPATDGTTVVWQDGRNAASADTTDYTNNFDLYAANLNDKKEILVSKGPQLQGRPKVAGNIVVWADYRDAKDKNDPNAGDIYMFDLSARQETQITRLPSAQTRPVTNGKVVVWVDFRNEKDPNGFNGDIYAYDITSKQEFPIVTAPDLQTDPAIYGNIVVWQDYRNAKDSNDYNADIYGYDLSTRKEFAITIAAGRQAEPAVAGNLVAWVDYRNESDQQNGVNSDIYGYDLASKKEFPVFLGAGTQDAPSVGGTTVAYETNPDVKGRGVWSINGVTVNGVLGGAIQPLAPPAQLPGSGSRTFPETGKTMSGIFLDYWNRNGGLAQQGFPISDVIGELSDLDGKPYTVQYYERAVFELHPENQAPYNVLLSQLGTFQYKRKYPNGAPGQKANTVNGQLFKETNHWVGGKFRQYWQEHGGLAQQGFPISDEFTEVSDLNGQAYTVQYFERAVFELHPENNPPNDVLLSQLGTFQYRQKNGGR